MEVKKYDLGNNYSYEVTKDGNVTISEKYFLFDEEHRNDDKPSSTYYYPNGNVKRREWKQIGKTHRDGNKHAVIELFESGKVKSVTFAKMGFIHREDDRPAIITQYESDESVKEMIRMRFGKDHADEDIPSYIKFDEAGKTIIQYYHKNGMFHRDEGFALIEGDKKEKWIHGEKQK